MNDLLEDINSRLKSLPDLFIISLRENDSLVHFVKKFIINILCERKGDIEFSFKESNKQFCKNNNIKDESQLSKYLKLKGMLMNDHERNLLNSKKVLIIAGDIFSEKAKSNFIKNKNLLDIYTYKYIEFFDSDFAHEIFFQLDSRETSFDKLFSENLKAIGNVKSYGTVGPLDLAKINPTVKEKILKTNLNEVITPFKVGDFWLLIMLEAKKEAKFDEITKTKMVLSLFDEWINLLAVDSIQKFLLPN